VLLSLILPLGCRSEESSPRPGASAAPAASASAAASDGARDAALTLPAVDAGPPTEVVFSEERLFLVEKKDPLSVWTGAAQDGSRKTIELKATDGVLLRGWQVSAPDPKAPYVVTFRGNNETIADAASQARDAFFYGPLNLNLVTFDYRGAGFSEGTVSLEKARGDALAIFDEVLKRAAGQPVFVCGWSLGSIFASHVAGSRATVAGLILLGPIASADSFVEDVLHVANMKLVIPPSFQLIQNATELRAYKNPLLVVHGTVDRVVPVHQGRLVHEAAASADKTLVVLEGKGHSGAIWSVEADNAIAAFVTRIAGTAKAAN
jgi:pimeloyl-ACP methyl ester carboxylesterase